MRIENVYPDLYSRSILAFEELIGIRGKVLGVIGRLANEPKIDERDPTFVGYKSGVTPSERMDALKRLWSMLNPYRNIQEVSVLVSSIEEDLPADTIIALVEETRKTEEMDAERERQSEIRRIEWEKRQFAREQNEDRVLEQVQ